MKMPDGGSQQAYSVEPATDNVRGSSWEVTSADTDAGQAAPIQKQVVKRTGRTPSPTLLDGGFATREDITAPEQRSVTVHTPVRLPRNRPEQERYQPHYEGGPVLRYAFTECSIHRTKTYQSH